ncbi:U6 snRNA phosphodiesterase Usb1 [Mycena amicta]|nr:U6 snRNA phosphodiesterase Usb1 [Mycena amicta]
MALVSYSSSESESEPPPPVKKRKLPTLATTLSGPVHIDDPSLHQGRTRSTPHVDGQWATHIYARVPLDPPFFQLVQSILESARTEVPSLHDFFSSESKSKPELHISLSRPVFLRAHQRDEMKRAVRRIVEQRSPFKASFARISSLTNDDATRIFLVLEIGAGHHELSALTNEFTPILRGMRQNEYYAAPRFHASIGWALLPGDTQSESHPNLATSSSNLSSPVFSPTLLPALNAEYGARLNSGVKSFDVGEIAIKIGKNVASWMLGARASGALAGS